MSGKRILVTGATGFLGSRIVETLVSLADVDLVLATGRTLRPWREVKHDNVEYQLGDLTEMAHVQSLFANQLTHVVHCAALSSPWGAYKEFYTANVTATERIINQIKSNTVQRLINISSPSIYFNYQDRLDIREDDPLPKKFVNHYAATKREAELAIEKSGVPFVTLRPRAIIGGGDTVIMPRMIRAHKEGRLKVIGSGKNVVDLTCVANVAEAVRLSLYADDTALMQSYNISDGSPVEIWSAIRDVLAELGMTLKPGKVPLAAARFFAMGLEGYHRWFTSTEPALTQYSISAPALNFTLDITKARRLLNYEPIMTTREGIQEFVNWYKSRHNG